MANKLALLYNFSMSVYTNIPSCRREESKTSSPLHVQEGIFVYSRVFVQYMHLVSLKG